jgi:hypothetical protein
VTRFYSWRVNGQWRGCPVEWWDALLGPKPDDDFDCNGCTSSPDRYMGYHIWPACRIHDWHYDIDGPDVPRILADLIFRINIWRILRAQNCPRLRAIYLSFAYWGAVSLVGRPFYRRGKRVP